MIYICLKNTWRHIFSMVLFTFHTKLDWHEWHFDSVWSCMPASSYTWRRIEMTLCHFNVPIKKGKHNLYANTWDCQNSIYCNALTSFRQYSSIFFWMWKYISFAWLEWHKGSGYAHSAAFYQTHATLCCKKWGSAIFWSRANVTFLLVASWQFSQ